MVLDCVPDGGLPEIVEVGLAPLPMDWLWSGQPSFKLSACRFYHVHEQTSPTDFLMSMPCQVQSR
jgi:hypothetical protein